MAAQDADPVRHGRDVCPTCGLTLSMFDPPQEHDHSADDAPSADPVVEGPLYVGLKVDGWVIVNRRGERVLLTEAVMRDLVAAFNAVWHSEHSDGTDRA